MSVWGRRTIVQPETAHNYHDSSSLSRPVKAATILWNRPRLTLKNWTGTVANRTPLPRMPEVSTIFTTVCVENRFNSVFTGKMMSAATSMTIEELIEEFDDLGDWADQCEVLIDMGRELPDMPTDMKTEQTKVHGCQSNVWMVASVSDDESRTIKLIADSDAMIVRGLLTVIMMVYSGRTAQEIHDTDIKAIFSRLGLDRHLSTARKNGLGGMVNRVQTIAKGALA